MREIIRLKLRDKVPNGARPLGVTVEKERTSDAYSGGAGGYSEVAVFYYDIEIAEPKEETKNVPAKRR